MVAREKCLKFVKMQKKLQKSAIFGVFGSEKVKNSGFLMSEILRY